MLTLQDPSWLDTNPPTSQGFIDLLANTEDIHEASYDRLRYYNLADMLGVNCAYHKGQHYCTMDQARCMRGETYPGTIVDKYWQYPEVHGHDRPYMNAAVGATKEYMSEHPEIQQFVDDNDDEDTLWAHCRLGDMGLMDQGGMNSLARACNSKPFKRVIICTGTLANWENLKRQHGQQGWSHPGTPEEMFDRTWHAMKIINENMPIPVQFCFGDCDEHFCMMYKTKNLWVHRGAFSMLLAFMGEGKIYLSPWAAHICDITRSYPRKDLSDRSNYVRAY